MAVSPEDVDGLAQCKGGRGKYRYGCIRDKEGFAYIRLKRDFQRGQKFGAPSPYKGEKRTLGKAKEKGAAIFLRLCNPKGKFSLFE